MLLILLTALISPAAGQTTDRLPDWLVPVVRVLPGDRVMPTTGIYIGAERVLVPSELTVEGGEVVVLDGGADLAQFGRSATIEQQFNRSGLTILRVAGLQRSEPVLGMPQGLVDADIALQGYPPPSMIAAGTASLTLRSELTERQGLLTINRDRPLPNVTGALIDACGNWIGHSAARGVASMGSSQNTQYRFADELQALLESAGVQLQIANCTRSWPEAVPAEPQPSVSGMDSDAPTPVTKNDSEAQAQEPPAESPNMLPESAVEPQTETIEEPAPPEDPEPGRSMDTPQDPAEVEDELSVWPWMLALVIASVAAAATMMIWRRRRGAVSAPVAGSTMVPGPPSDIQPIARLVSSRVQHVLVAEREQVDVLIGRFDADFLLRSSSASREHARLCGSPDALLLEDLGSSNGTWVNGVRCTAHEAVSVQFGDELKFADESYRLEPLPGDDAP